MTGPEPYIRVGQIVGTHGVKGGLKVRVLTDFPERFEPGKSLFLRGEGRKVLSASWHRDQVRIHLEGVDDMTTAEFLQWEYLSVPASSRPEHDPDVLLERDLLGVPVIADDGKMIGPLDEVLHAPAQDLFRVGQTLIPVVSEFVKEIDVAGRRIVVHLIPGMLDDDEAERVEPEPHQPAHGKPKRRRS